MAYLLTKASIEISNLLVLITKEAAKRKKAQ